MSNTKPGGPAFPAAKIISGDNYNPPTKVYHSGMTLRQYAAIKLKVPDSGTDWLDDMIRKSNELDMMLLTNPQQSNTL
jgi:hypothetical protein